MPDQPLPGHLRWPYPTVECANPECPDPTLTPQTQAVLFADLTTSQFAVFCGPCSLTVELFHGDRWRLVGA
ncbi:hypothetical protein [Nocardioides pakistanensis]